MQDISNSHSQNVKLQFMIPTREIISFFCIGVVQHPMPSLEKHWMRYL
jgi:hypothetical protein